MQTARSSIVTHPVLPFLLDYLFFLTENLKRKLKVRKKTAYKQIFPVVTQLKSSGEKIVLNKPC